MARAEVGFAGCLGKFIPRTDQLAVVAAVDAVTHRGAQILGNHPVIFDGQIRDTFARVEHPRVDERAGRTGI